MRLLLLASLALVPASLLAGCTGGGAGPAFETHDVAEWKSRLEATPNAFVLDVRTRAEFDAGHLANATLVPYDALSSNTHLLPADKATPIFIYCRSGHRSGIGSETLASLGYTSIHNMGGGLVDWSAAGYPVTA